MLASGRLLRRLQADRRAGTGSWARQLVYAYGIGMLWFLPLSASVIAPALGWTTLERFIVQMLAVLAMPFVFATGILRGRFARSGRIDELAAWIGAEPGSRLSLRDALAAALGDPTVTLQPLTTGARAIDPADVPGEPAVAAAQATTAASALAPGTPEPPPERGVAVVQGAQGPIAAISYDAVLVPDPAVVEAAGRVIALALEREQLTAELLASRERIRASRARLVEVADAERRRIAADLHDGIQARLVVSALRAGALAAGSASSSPSPSPAAAALAVTPSPALVPAVSPNPAAATAAAAAAAGAAPLSDALAAAAIRDEINRVIDDLRRLVQGLMPAVLLERGLFAAVEDLLDRLPVHATLHLGGDHLDAPLPPAVASTGYFIVSEAVTNALKHAAPPTWWSTSAGSRPAS